MVEPGGGLGLAAEPVEQRGVAGEVGAQHLDGDRPGEPGVVAVVDLGHAAAAEEVPDLVTPAEQAWCAHLCFPPRPLPLPCALPWVCFADCRGATGAVAAAVAAGDGDRCVVVGVRAVAVVTGVVATLVAGVPRGWVGVALASPRVPSSAASRTATTSSSTAATTAGTTHAGRRPRQPSTAGGASGAAGSPAYGCTSPVAGRGSMTPVGSGLSGASPAGAPTMTGATAEAAPWASSTGISPTGRRSASAKAAALSGRCSGPLASDAITVVRSGSGTVLGRG